MSQRPPPLKALYAFDAVAQQGSVTQAAVLLHVTHGAISRHIRQLEEQLGVRLFERQGRGLVLTDAGAQLHQTTQTAFALLQEGYQSLQSQAQHTVLRVGCPGSLLARWLIPRLEHLNQSLPHLSVQFCATDHNTASVPTGLEAWLCFASPPWPAGVQVTELIAERVGPIVSPAYLKNRHTRPDSFHLLQQEPLLYTRSRPQAWPDWATSQGILAETLHMGQGFDHLYYLLEAVRAGLGIGIAPQLLVSDDLHNQVLTAPWGFTQTQAKLVLMSAHTQCPRIAQLIEWLKQQLSRSA